MVRGYLCAGPHAGFRVGPDLGASKDYRDEVFRSDPGWVAMLPLEVFWAQTPMQMKIGASEDILLHLCTWSEHRSLVYMFAWSERRAHNL